jgi:hypothetical protein
VYGGSDLDNWEVNNVAAILDDLRWLSIDDSTSFIPHFYKSFPVAQEVLHIVL